MLKNSLLHRIASTFGYDKLSDEEFLEALASVVGESESGEDVPRDQAKEILDRLAKVSPAVAKPLCPKGSITHYLCPSVLSGIGIEPLPFPFWIPNWSIFDLLDEYFGGCYCDKSDSLGVDYKEHILTELLRRRPKLQALLLDPDADFDTISEMYNGVLDPMDVRRFIEAIPLDTDLGVLTDPADIEDWLVTQTPGPAVEFLATAFEADNRDR
jgi:hypothetical protein